MRALLTGATGFVGSHVAEALLDRGDEVTCLVRRPEAASFLAARGAQIMPGSLDDGPSLERAAQGADVVYHVAGLLGGRPTDLFRVNVDGTRRVADAVRRVAGGAARLVYVSSQAAVGPGLLVNEDAPCRPVSPYGRSKLAGERAARESGLEWTIVRPSVVYGPRDRALLTLFRLAQRRLAPVFGSGTQEISLIYGPDLARALVLAGTTAAAAGKVYHMAHERTVVTRELAREVARALGRRTIELAVPRMVAAAVLGAASLLAALVSKSGVLDPGKLDEYYAPAWTFDVSRAARELNWRAATNHVTGIAATAAWYREAGWL